MSDKLKKIQGVSDKTSKDIQKKYTAAGKKAQVIGNKVTKVGQGLTTHLTMPLMGVAAASLKVGMDFEAEMSKVQAISGAMGDDFDALKKKAREMGAQTKFSATESAEAMEYMAMAGWKTEDMLGGIEGVLNLAAASGEDLATTSDIVTDAMTAFGIEVDKEGKNVNHFADVLAAASSNANTNVSMMGETFKYAAPIAGSLGYSIEDTAEAIGLMANAGIKSSQAGTSLRKIMTELSGDVKIAGQNIGEVTVKTTNADGTMRDFSDIIGDCRQAFSGLTESERATQAESLVGKTAMSGFLAMMNAGTDDVNKLSGAINDCDNAAADMAATMQDNTAGALTILKSGLEEAGLSINDTLAPYARKLVEIMQNLTNKFNNLDPKTKDMIVKIGLIVAAIGPALLIIGKIISIVGTVIMVAGKVITIIKTITSVIGILNAVILANPIILTITAIIAIIVAAGIIWYKYHDQIMEIIASITAKLQEFVGKVKEKIGQIIETIKEKIQAIKDKILEFKNNAKQIFTEIGDTIKSALLKPFEWISGKIEAFKDGVGNIVDAAKEKAAAVKEKVAGNALGTSYYKGGQTWVGEHGPELLSLPSGSKIYSNQKSKGMASAPSVTVNVTVQGNIIGNEEYANMLSEKITGNLLTQMAYG